ncbi:MAG TPA: hypothetical protein VI895_06015, partial [Bdellovibrionota bacterium]|nr:hypothetical protein [Bdellovibrionota bacterium]
MIQLVWRTFGRSMTLIPAHYRRQSYGIAALLLTQSFLDVLGLGLIVSLAPMLFDRERVMRFSLYKRINYALGEPTYQTTLVVALVIIVVAYAVKNAISIWIAHRQARFAFNIYHSLTTRLHKLSFDRGYLYLRKRNSTEVVRDVAAIPGRFSENILLPLLLFLNEALVLLVVVLSVLWLDPYAFVFVALIVLPPSLVFFHLVKNHVSQVQERVNLLSAQLQKSLFESIFGYADVRTTRTQDYFFSRYSALVKDYCGCLRLSTVYNVLPGRLLELFFVLGVVSLGAYIAFRIQDAGLATTFLATYAIAAYRTLPSINRMTLAL